MKPRPGSASEFVLETLSRYADRELRVSDLSVLADGRFKRDNIALSLQALLKDGQVVKNKDGSEAWWAITLPDVTAAGQAAAPEGDAAAPTKVHAHRPTMQIKSSRW